LRIVEKVISRRLSDHSANQALERQQVTYGDREAFLCRSRCVVRQSPPPPAHVYNGTITPLAQFDAQKFVVINLMICRPDASRRRSRCTVALKRRLRYFTHGQFAPARSRRATAGRANFLGPPVFTLVE
jgi:hypothetical protein